MAQQSLAEILKRRLGIDTPNPMQQAVWASNAGRLVILSPTGTGKTAAFGALLVRLLKPENDHVQAVVLAPTRELVLQIHEVLRKLAAPEFKTTALYGKHSMADEVASLSVAPQIAVATPGRLLDHIERRSIELNDARVLIIDEYDKALEMGFHDQMRRICRTIKHPDNIVLTSATALVEKPDFIDLKDAEVIDYTDSGAKNNRTHIALVESPVRDKLQTLVDLLRSLQNGKIIVFVNHRESAERVYSALKERHLPVGLYHGALEQLDRERALIQLENASTPILVATDLAARGLDISDVDTVIHYHMPVSQQVWTHRNGRTARVDASGNIFVIVSEADSIPDYVVWDSPYNPSGTSDSPIRATNATLYINAGRKEKISRGDIVGFLINNLELEASQIGKIDVRDHSAYVAVPRDILPKIYSLQSPKIKGKRVRISPLK